MPFKYDFSDELEDTLAKLFKKDRNAYEALLKKIDEIASRDEFTIEFYKNLRYDLKEYKRVHVTKSFVLMFKVFKKEKFILFDKFRHHDDVYKR
ncbi:MAG: addiction module toxin RelE [Candidatus Diapherotrites archaeon]